MAKPSSTSMLRRPELPTPAMRAAFSTDEWACEDA
jgi:hypothetical protein